MDLGKSNLWREIHEEPEALHNCLQKNLPVIREIAVEVKKRNIKTVVFAGRGSSDHANQVGRYLFETYCGMIASISAPSVLTCYEGKIDYSNTLLIGVSQSGGAKDLALVMEKAVQQGAIVVSLTNENDSIMANIGTYRLNNECGKETSVTAAKSYLTQVAVIAALAEEISQNKELSETINQLPDIAAYALTLEDQVRSVLPLIRNSQHLMLFGRGLLYALAQETELKIQETSYLDARCYGVADYQHGPIASADSFVPAILFAADQKTDSSTVMLLGRLQKEHNVFTILVTNKKDIALKGNAAILFDGKYDGLSAVIICAVVSQMMACLLSISRGFNPDNPVGVSKHTVTV